MFTKNTKVICTLGPSSDSVKKLVALVNAGMNVARLNFSHGNYENHAMLINNIHKAEKLTGKTVGVLQDLQGPKIRIGKMPEDGIRIEDDEKFILTTQNIVGEKTKKNTIIPIQYKNLVKEVKKGDTILINDGLIEVKVLKTTKTHLVCQVKVGGLIKTGKGVNFPTSSISQTTITEKDKRDLEFGLNMGVDFIALSFVRGKQDILGLRKLIKKHGKNTQIIAKIERHEAVNNMSEIIKASDGVMVARGDLGADIAPEKVPIVQKRIIALANKYGKPVITATEVLYSMIKNARATRAEISDAANAIYDQTDAIMLSNETAIGKYALEATATLSKVAVVVEKELQKHQELLANLPTQIKLNEIDATCLNACELAKDSRSDYLVVYSESGYTARHVAKYRLFTPIITLTNNNQTARELTLVWGTNQVHMINLPQDPNQKISKIIEQIKAQKLVKKGKKIVIVCNASKKEKLITSYKI